MYSREASRRAGLKESGDRHDRHEQPVHAGLCHLHDIGGVPEVRGLVRPVHVGIVPMAGAIMAGITFHSTRQASRGSAAGKA